MEILHFTITLKLTKVDRTEEEGSKAEQLNGLTKKMLK